MPIQILPAMLANQIAAGEVVERPASVVKELVENSLDAGASKIDIDIEKGGHKRICIRDNGGGIAEHELVLALSRHATSKISTLDDLEQIMSLGFRGEALASISSVARLTLTSRTAEQSAAWQAYAEGRDMQVQVQPAAHPVGTSVDVQDLFFNTPARRKFLRAEKTEFTHIDELLRRIALSRFDVQFVLRHNGKVARRYPAVTADADRRKRLAAVTSEQMATHSLDVSSRYGDLHLYGWLDSNRDASNDIQYFYVNGRMMRDKLINHALRQACNEVFGEQHQLGYVLYLDLPPQDVDINVHPAKHEVRFQQARHIHDFIYRAIVDMLNQEGVAAANEISPVQLSRTLQPAEPKHSYITPLSQQSHAAATYSVGSSTGSKATNSREASAAYTALVTPRAQPQPSGLQWLLSQDGLLLVNASPLLVLPASTPLNWYLQHLIASQQLVSQPLLMPLSVALSPEDVHQCLAHSDAMASLGIHYILHDQRLILRQVPACLRELNWAELLSALIQHNEVNADSLCAVIQSASAGLNRNVLMPVWQWAERHFGTHWLPTLKQAGKPLDIQDWFIHAP